MRRILQFSNASSPVQYSTFLGRIVGSRTPSEQPKEWGGMGTHPLPVVLHG